MLEERYYKIAELAELLSVSPRTVHGWVRKKWIGVTRFGRREVRFSESQVQAFLKVQNVRGKKPKSIWTKE